MGRDKDLVEAAQELEFLLRQLNYLLNQATRRYLAQHGLSLSRVWVLAALYQAGCLSMNELQEHMLLAPSTLTGLADGLVAAGLVERERDEDDRRVVKLRLAPAGKEVLEEVLSQRRKILAKAAAAVEPAEIRRLNACLRVIFTNLRKETEMEGICSTDGEGEGHGEQP